MNIWAGYSYDRSFPGIITLNYLDLEGHNSIGTETLETRQTKGTRWIIPQFISPIVPFAE